MLQLATAAVFVFDECEDTELVRYHVAIFDVLRLDTLLRKRIPRARSRGQVAGGFQNREEHSLTVHPHLSKPFDARRSVFRTTA